MIHVTPQDTTAFFGIPVLPEPQVPAEVLDTFEAGDMVNDEHARLINLPAVAMPVFAHVPGGCPFTSAENEASLHTCSKGINLVPHDLHDCSPPALSSVSVGTDTEDTIFPIISSSDA